MRRTPALNITPDTFGSIIEGARGMIVFGNGIDALTGQVAEVGEDYILFEEVGGIHGKRNFDLRHAIPLTSIVYFRYDDDA